MLQLESPCLASAHTARHFGFLEGFIFFLSACLFLGFSCLCFASPFYFWSPMQACPDFSKAGPDWSPLKPQRWDNHIWAGFLHGPPLGAAFLNLYQRTPWCAISLFITSDNWFSVCKVVSTVFVHIIAYFSHKAPPAICECCDDIVF